MKLIHKTKQLFIKIDTVIVRSPAEAGMKLRVLDSKNEPDPLNEIILLLCQSNETIVWNNKIIYQITNTLLTLS